MANNGLQSSICRLQMFGLIILENDSLVIVKYFQPNCPFLYAKNIYQKMWVSIFFIVIDLYLCIPVQTNALQALIHLYMCSTVISIYRFYCEPYQLIMPVCDREADRLILETVKQQGPASETYEWLARQLGIWTSEQVRSAIFWYSQHFGRVRGLVGRKVQWIEQFVCSSSFH